jgi:hypothetical protein
VNSRWALLIIIAMIIAGFYLRNTERKKPPPELPVEVKNVEIKKTVLPPLQSPQPKMTLAQLPQQQPKPNPQSPHAYPQPPAGLVEFEIVNGVAIAFGDVILGKPDIAEVLAHGFYEPPTKPGLWGKEIPYLIAPDLPDPDRIMRAITLLNEKTSVKFVPFNGQADAIVFQRGDEHCYSYLGRVGGQQPIMLSDPCRTQEILHELLHALGLIHEHSRMDRDNYVDVVWENIDERYKVQFSMVPEKLMERVKGTAFDFQSIMLYAPNAFAASPELLTLKSKTGQPIAPIKEGLSPLDLQKIEALYAK